MEIFIKGIIVGLSVSVPLGPIGMLCIQRTLNRGQKHGMVTGLGATTSDIVYAIITLFFLSFVLDFIEQHRVVIQVIGSVIILVFGWWIYRSNPVAHPSVKDKIENASLFSDFITSFGLTLSNPLILFVLIALFAKLEFITSEASIGMQMFGLFSVLLGATAWWTVLTTFANKFRHRFNVRGLKLINKITGSIIAVIGAVGLVSTFLG